MELWSSNHDAYSHKCRIVLGEKDIDKSVMVQVRYVDINNKPDNLARMNPLNRVPVLIDQNHNLALYESNIINEYIDERFPHPQLMPMGVSTKGRARLLLFEYDSELYSLMDQILVSKPGKKLDHKRKVLAEALLALSQKIEGQYMLGNEFSMVDASLAPLLWRLEYLGIRLPPKAAPLLKYAEKVFSRPSFRNSLRPPEKEMRR